MTKSPTFTISSPEMTMPKQEYPAGLLLVQGAPSCLVPFQLMLLRCDKKLTLLIPLRSFHCGQKNFVRKPPDSSRFTSDCFKSIIHINCERVAPYLSYNSVLFVDRNQTSNWWKTRSDWNVWVLHSQEWTLLTISIETSVLLDQGHCRFFALSFERSILLALDCVAITSLGDVINLKDDGTILGISDVSADLAV